MPGEKDKWEAEQESVEEERQGISRREALKCVAYIAPATALLLTSSRVMADSGPPAPTCPPIAITVTNTGATTNAKVTATICQNGVPTQAIATAVFPAGGVQNGNDAENSFITYERASDGAGRQTFGPITASNNSFSWNGPG